MDVRRGKKSPLGGSVFESFGPMLGGQRTDPE